MSRGITIFFTGLPGAGKTTIATALTECLEKEFLRTVTLLDGDAVRQYLSSELGFSKEHRDLNIRRIGYVAAEITRHGGICICSPIAPYDSTRKEIRRKIEQLGHFLLVYINTPIEICEARDPKGLYAKARSGMIPSFTGVSAPYEVPTDPDVVIHTTRQTSAEAVRVILRHIQLS